MESPSRKDIVSGFSDPIGMKDNSKNNDSARQNVSFKFTKSTSKKLVGNKLEEDGVSKDELVTSVEDKEIKSVVPKEVKKELVIPLIKKNTWRLLETKTDQGGQDVDDKEKVLNAMALNEVLKESSMENEKWEKRESAADITVPLMVQNKVPEGYETDAKIDVSLRPEESTLEDYEKVPVDAFGLAVLRGMGWKPGDAIGGKNKKCVKPVEVVVRPKGLGLGADKSALNKSAAKDNNEEKLELLKKSYVRVTQGTHKGQYGQVEGLDDENARAIIKLATDDKCLTLPEFYLQVVSKKEYQKESKVINRLAYDKYVEDNKDRKRGYENGHTEDRTLEDRSSTKRKERHRSPDRNRDAGERSHHKKRKCSKERKSEKSEKKHSSADHHEKLEMWVSTHLKVRFIDDQYKKGKYFNQKMIVEDILSPKYCVCKTEDGKYLDDIKPSMLETVIPRTDSAHVMIVLGKHKGQLGVILKKDKAKCMATIQLLQDREKVTHLGYDSICEYTGDVSQFD